ncbi:putative LOB domain-containing protein [Melia azedarach]|uniref:LOB domain-containing protein n=1 Tax=Melia azedarach TaxID=155640 RepID=A0ACC1Y2E2_MELAZ|nr:putative LOB domain-containing protein [Melia azedarach]
MSNIPRIGSSNGATTTQACAACKYQRRKCAPDCILAPYFPHDRQRQFLNAHKLFGVSNITKIIKTLDPPEKDEAMRTIIFQSDVRASDPVGGCYRIIRELQRQIEYNKAELELVLHQLAICRAQTQQQPQNPLQMPETDDSVLSYEIMNAATEPLNVQNYTYNVQPTPTPQQQDQEFVNIQNQLQQEEDVNAWAMQDPTIISTLNVNNDNDISSNDDVKPQFVEIPYERHDVKFEQDQEGLVERRFVPSTQLLISS